MPEEVTDSMGEVECMHFLYCTLHGILKVFCFVLLCFVLAVLSVVNQVLLQIALNFAGLPKPNMV